MGKLRLRFDLRFRRGWIKKRRVTQYYNRLASTYETQYAEEQTEKILATLGRVHPEGGSLILDVGCGTGLLFEYLGDSVKLMVGLDVSKDILKEAQRRTKGFSAVSVILADADFLPFPNGHFDFVFAFTLLQNMPNPYLTLHEIRRVCRSTSTLVVTGFKRFQVHRFFYRSTFSRLLQETGLQASVIVEDKHLKDYVAICKL